MKQTNSQQIKQMENISLLGRIGGRKFGAVLLSSLLLLLGLLLAVFVLPESGLAWKAVEGLTTAFIVICIGFYGGNVGEKWLPKKLDK